MYTKLILIIIHILTMCSNYHTSHWFLSGKPLICYLHNLSSMKVSHSNNDYFDVTLQTKDKHLRGICFSPDKMKPMKSRFKSLSPVKLNNYAVKKKKIHRWRRHSHKQKNKDLWSNSQWTWFWHQTTKTWPGFGNVGYSKWHHRTKHLMYQNVHFRSYIHREKYRNHSSQW